MKDKLIFDTTDANTIADSDSIGAYLRSSDGSLIDHIVQGLTFAQFSGQVAGMTTNVVIDAVVAGAAGNITLVADSVSTIDQLIAAHNGLNPANTVSLASGDDGTQIPTANIVLSGGDDGIARLAVDSILKDGAGNALTSTAGALNVNLSSPMSIDVDLDHTTGDSVQIGDGTEIMEVNFDGSINAVVTATDLDIRDLSNLTDSVTAHQGGIWSVTVDNPFDGVVTATDLDIRDLAHTQDSVRVGDGVNLIGSTAVNLVNGLNTYILNEEIAVNLQDGVGTPLTSTAGALDVNIANSITVDDAALANTSIVSAAKATAGDVVTAPLAGRKYLYVYNNGNQKMFLGATGVTSATGFPLSPGSYLELRAGAAVDVEFAAGGNIDVRSLELA